MKDMELYVRVPEDVYKKAKKIADHIDVTVTSVLALEVERLMDDVEKGIDHVMELYGLKEEA